MISAKTSNYKIYTDNVNTGDSLVLVYINSSTYQTQSMNNSTKNILTIYSILEYIVCNLFILCLLNGICFSYMIIGT